MKTRGKHLSLSALLSLMVFVVPSLLVAQHQSPIQNPTSAYHPSAASLDTQVVYFSTQTPFRHRNKLRGVLKGNGGMDSSGFVHHFYDKFDTQVIYLQPKSGFRSEGDRAQNGFSTDIANLEWKEGHGLSVLKTHITRVD